MAIVETRLSVWEALAGRAPGQPVGPADPGLWSAVSERLNPAKAKPVLRAGVEMSELKSVRGVKYTMLRSPDDGRSRAQRAAGATACYLRLTPEEATLAELMDGTRTLARLVAEFARISGRLAPDQVRRVVADLAGNRMLDELPVDAFRPLSKMKRRPWPIRFGRGLLAFAQGRRMVVANVDPLFRFLYRAGGRLLFTRPMVALLTVIATAGLVAFGWQWWSGEQSIFLTNNSYLTGALVLLGLNVLALACHEIGHGLATKHAGRRIPAAGFLIYFGIPSVFVDTTDVWMAGRRARLRTTAAGPAAGLILAGASALVGVFSPELAPWCFKLSFAWYVNALFNLNPFLALDGYYLVMDWLELPNLRARGLAWVASRLRGRPPRWSTLDREGRLVALYGLLALGWLLIAFNIGYRIYVDRVSGLVLGLWRHGWGSRVVLIAVVAALASPVVYLIAGWFGRRLRRTGQRFSERRVEADAPRRLAALRASSLRDLSPELLAGLARQATWVHPRTGQQLVFAGSAQPQVLTVVEGALEGRAPGDPVGTVRERVGVGGVVGLGAAATGSPSALSWYAAGTKLLAVPSPAVAAALGPVGGVLGVSTAAEAEALFAEAPGLAGLSVEDRLGLAGVAKPVSLAPGESVILGGADEAIVLVSGVVAPPTGGTLGRGTLIGPSGEPHGATFGTARTPVRAFEIPAVSGLALLLGAGGSGGSSVDGSGRAPGRAPVTGVHPPAAYPPLASPPGPPPPGVDDESDRGFERRLWWLLILVLLFGLLLTGGNILSGPAWAEMPTDKALLHVDTGTVDVVVDGQLVRLNKNDKIYVGAGDQVSVHDRSRGQLTYRGGGYSILCAQVHLTVGTLQSTSGRPVVPSASLSIVDGLVLNDTATPSSAFADTDMTTVAGGSTVASQGEAWYAVAPGFVDVSTGTVTRDGSALEPSGHALGCGDGSVVPQPNPPVTASPTPSDSPTPSPSDSPTPSPTPSPTFGPTTSAVPPTTTTTKKKTTTKPATTATHPTTTKPPNKPPVFTSWSLLADPVAQLPDPQTYCAGQKQASEQIAEGVYANLTDADDPVTSLSVYFTWSLNTDPTVGGTVKMNLGDGIFAGSFLVHYSQSHIDGGILTIKIYAIDPAGNKVGPKTLTATLDVCRETPIVK